jgi:5S rRNA maturation endonuclease (ribonuclease M5)
MIEKEYNRKKNIVIKKSNIILVEGKDDKIFFEELINFIKKDKEIQVIEYEGKDNLKNRIKVLLKTPDFSNVKNLIIVRDADENPQTAFQSVITILQNYNFSIPSKPYEVVEGNPNIGVILLPDENEPGNLESLCLKAFKNNKQIYTCVENYIECLKNNGVYIKKLSKTKFYAFLSATEEPEIKFSTFVKDPNLLDFRHSAFKKLLNFIEKKI